MKHPRRWLAAAVAAPVLLAAAQLVVSRAVVRGIRRAMPALGEMLGVRVEMGAARFVLFRPALKAAGFTIGNPPGFSEPALLEIRRGHLGVSLAHLPFGVLRIPRAELQDVALHVVRNPDGAVNLLRVAEAADAYDLAHPEEADEAERGGLILRRVRAEGVVKCVDRAVPDGDPFVLDLAVALRAANISTVAGGRAEPGDFRLQGHAADDPDAFVFDFRGTAAPLTNTACPTFELHGTIENIDMRRLDRLTARAGVHGESASVRADLKCVDGRFDPARSVVEVKLEKARLAGRLADRAGMSRPLPTLTVAMPVGGTIEDPRFDWMTALSETLVRDFGSGLNELFEGSGLKPPGQADRRSFDRAVNEALRGMSGLFAPRKKE
ncbi:MAG: hypothetical protein FJ225_03975 [Lentisphaerae bacterium]|nr:hypothetical protein [Lentisphaerota bacterium]